MLRLLPQWYLSNKQAVPSSASQIHRMYLLSIIFTYLVCTFLHIVLDPPHGDELSRGYIHGAFLTDFVGEPAPVPKGKMLLVDFCVLALQLLLLAAVLEKRDLKLRTVDQTSSNGAGASLRSINLQDLDAEEQGVRRSQEGNVYDELAVEDGTPNELTAEGNVLDDSYGGQIVIMTFSLGGMINRAWLS